MKKFKDIVRKNLTNIPGWKTQRKIVVIESDDWGSLRMPSQEALKKLVSNGFKVEKCHYMMNDSLASIEDLNFLFELLINFKDKAKSHPIITSNTIVANPDFNAIEEGEFRNYYYENIVETFEKFGNESHSFELWKDGMKSGVFHPQFHGREHLQVSRWMEYLIENAKTKLAFHEKVFGVSTNVVNNTRKSFLAAYDYNTKEELNDICTIISDGLNLFERIFGYRSKSTIAPNYTWNREMEKVFIEGGVEFLQGGGVQRSPHHVQKKNLRHYTGQKNDLGQIYLVRNCSFEPSSNPQYDWVNSCLYDINTSFRWNKPAIIESHRVNYVGYINPVNRDRNLKLLEELLSKIMQIWPDVEFMSSDQLGNLIKEG